MCAPLFIIGSPRSGTTLLASLLRDTPWGSPVETHFIPKYYRYLASASDVSDRETFARVTRRILDERPIAQLRLGVTPDGLYRSLARHDYAALVDAIGLACAARQGRPSWGDKTPHYIDHVPLLHSLFPRSKMLYIVRDGRDVALSLLQKSWGPANVYVCARKWRDENQPREILQTLRVAGQLHDLRYEDLVRDPVGTLRGVMDFLGHEISGSALDALVATVRREGSARWKRGMTARQIRIFERVAGDRLRAFGYGVSYPCRPVNPASALAYKAHDSLKHATNLFMMNVVDTLRIRYLGAEPFAK